jgi:AcrR family transcriptional regulator
MSEQRVAQILDAAYRCFTKHGVRRTTMDDIAAAAGMSRPAVYQYVRNKDDAFRRLAGRMFAAALAEARAAGSTDGSLTERLTAVCGVKLGLTLQVWHDSPHAAELIGTNQRLGTDLDTGFTTGMRDVLAEVLAAAAAAGTIDLSAVDGGAQEVAELLLALTRGLEADLTDPELPRRRLRDGVTLLVAGLARA